MPEINIKEYQKAFVDMGDHCYGLVRDTYERYSGGYVPPLLNSSNFPKQKGAKDVYRGISGPTQKSQRFSNNIARCLAGLRVF